MCTGKNRTLHFYAHLTKIPSKNQDGRASRSKLLAALTGRFLCGQHCTPDPFESPANHPAPVFFSNLLPPACDVNRWVDMLNGH